MTLNGGQVIENDLLSLIYHKIDSCSKNKLLRCTSKYYSKEAINEAYNILFSSLSQSILEKLANRNKSSNPLVAIYSCISQLSRDDVPLLVCKDLNNIPAFAQSSVKTFTDLRNTEDSPHSVLIKQEPEEMNAEMGLVESQGQASKDDNEEDSELQQYREDLEEMKLQITDIAAVVLQIKDQIDQISSASSNPPPAKVRKIQARNSLVKSSNRKNESDDSKPASGLAYLQKLIDEEQTKTGACIKEENQEEPSENIFVVTQPLNSWLSDAQDKDKESNKSSEKVIYIKDETELCHTRLPPTVSIDENENDTDVTVPLTGSLDDEDTFIVDMSRPNQCDICNKSFPTQEGLESHMESHPPRNQFDCILCDKSFRSRKDLREHFLLCFKDNEERLLLDGLICTTCGRMYGDTVALRQHKTVHSAAKPYACPHCTYRYLTKKMLDSHIKTLHNKLNKYFCPFCDHSYISNNYLLVHIRSHTGEKPFKCKQCDYKAATPSLVARHMKRHEIQEEYACDLCDYICRGSENLRSHKSKMHRNNLIKCRVCGREFKNATIYSNHFLTHSGEKSFKCPLCPYAGLTKATLTSHMKIHSGKDLLICPHCSMPFRTNFSFKRHLRTHRGDD